MLQERAQHTSFTPEKNLTQFSLNYYFPSKMSSKEHRNSNLKAQRYPERGSASDWMKQILKQSERLPRSE